MRKCSLTREWMVWPNVPGHVRLKCKYSFTKINQHYSTSHSKPGLLFCCFRDAVYVASEQQRNTTVCSSYFIHLWWDCSTEARSFLRAQRRQLSERLNPLTHTHTHIETVHTHTYMKAQWIAYCRAPLCTHMYIDVTFRHSRSELFSISFSL